MLQEEETIPKVGVITILIPFLQKTHQHRHNEGITHKIRQSESLSRLSDPLREKTLPQFQWGRLKLCHKGHDG